MRANLPVVAATVRRALLGAADERWTPPPWLLAHQAPAAQRLAARLSYFHGALLADAPGLGKTYVGLALATRYRGALALVPASLVTQWRSLARSLGVELDVVSHEALSRGTPIPAAGLVVVDEAHRFRNPATRRYDALARRAPASHLLLLTATPVVNRAADVVHLLRLFLPDHGLAVFGVPSIERALAARAHGELAHACAGLVVARTTQVSAAVAGAMPAVSDVAVLAAPPATLSRVEQMSAAIDGLHFPSFQLQEAAALLRLHLYARLASSVPALTSTLHRHRRYLDHAIAAARRGEPISRHAAWLIIGPEDTAQLDLPGLRAADAASPLDVSRLEAERQRIVSLLESLATEDGTDPKADALEALLSRHPAKSIVFTSAVATAHHLARHLGWRRLAIATGRGARIATGPVTLDEALALFAPRAQGARPPAAALEVHTLIATDLVSEGLNLQDAERVIHFDLPWSPLRLEQRVGRVARLGSRHSAVHVAWFLPPEVLERRLALAARIAHKVRAQLELGAAASSRVGRAYVAGGLFDWREQLNPVPPEPAARTPHYAVVQAPPSAAFAIRWTGGSAEIPVVIVIDGEPPLVIRDERRAALVLERLLAAPVIEGPRPHAPLALLRSELRARIATLEAGPSDGGTRRLAKRIVRRARLAGKARNQPIVALLDRALDQLTAGLAAGAARALGERLDTPRSLAALREWVGQLPPAARVCPDVVLDAALFARSDAVAPWQPRGILAARALHPGENP